MLKWLSSLKVAVFLIAAIAAISVLATIYPSADAFNSWSFRFLVLAFFVNLSLCTLKVLPSFWKQLHRTAADVPEQGEYLVYEATAEEVETWLKEEHYAIRKQDTDGRVKILARKGVVGLAAPHILHISLLIVIVGAMLSTLNAEGYVMGQIGQTRPFPEDLRGQYGEDSSIEILDFETAYDDQKTIDNWITHFNLYVDGKLVAENAETKVNAPYQYKNMRIYQNSYQYRYLLEVAGSPNEEENTTYGVPDNQSVHAAGQAIAVANIDGTIYMQISDAENNSRRGQAVKPGDTLALNDEGTTVTYLDTAAYTILELKTRRGTAIVFIGFILATIASFLFMCGRYQEIRILADSKKKESKLWCYSKSRAVTEMIQDQWTERWKRQ